MPLLAFPLLLDCAISWNPYWLNWNDSVLCSSSGFPLTQDYLWGYKTSYCGLGGTKDENLHIHQWLDNLGRFPIIPTFQHHHFQVEVFALFCLSHIIFPYRGLPGLVGHGMASPGQLVLHPTFRQRLTAVLTTVYLSHNYSACMGYPPLARYFFCCLQVVHVGHLL